jgi:hypothetical protein
MSRGWKVAIGVVALVFVALVGVVSIASTSDDEGSSRYGRFTEMEMSGEMHDMLERHRVMLDRMQEDASPAMLRLMNEDPMWQMMRSPEWARMDEEHQRDVERMLGK